MFLYSTSKRYWELYQMWLSSLSMIFLVCVLIMIHLNKLSTIFTQDQFNFLISSLCFWSMFVIGDSWCACVVQQMASYAVSQASVLTWRHCKHAREVAQGVQSLLLFVLSSRSKIEELNIVKSVKLREKIEMEVMESPLNHVSDFYNSITL